MLNRFFLNDLRRFWSIAFSRPNGRTQQGKTKRAFGVEQLEDRCVPATFIWNWQQENPNTNWSDPANWQGPAGEYPGQNTGDIAIFRGTQSNNPATLNIELPNPLGAIQVESTYTSTIELAEKLDVQSTTLVSKLEAGTITGDSNFNFGVATSAQLNPPVGTNNGTFEWTGGTFSGEEW